MPIDKISGTLWSAMSKVSPTPHSNISKVSGVAAPSTGTPWSSTIYTFDNQTNDTTTTGWVPGGTNPNYATDGWLNGTNCVNGSVWKAGHALNGLQMDSGGTASSSTGPAGGMTSETDGTPDSAANKRYMYKESSGFLRTYDTVVRTPGYNFSQLMNNTGANLRMVLWYHAYGSNIVNNIYEVWTDTATTTNQASAANIKTLAAAGNTMSATTNPYAIQYIDLNSYRTLNQTNYFWIVIGQMTGFRGDVAIDTVYFEEYT